jgi:UDP:flavonoid glycosyltransferase YjiC (YdhE family)
MKILVSSVGSHGHTYPLLPLSVAARDAGHEVLYATSASFHPLLGRLGFRPLPAGMEMREAFQGLFAELGDRAPRDRASVTPEQTLAFARRVFGDIVPRRVVADLGPLLAEHRPDLVIHESGMVGAGLAARIAGIPGVCHGFGRVGDGLFTGEYTLALAAELGLDLPAELPPGLGDPYVDICPASLQNATFLATARRVPLRPVAFAEPQPLPGWVREPGPPLVYLTMGTAFGDATVLEKAIAGLSRLDARVLVAAGPTVDLGALGELPANVHVEAWVPQAEVLPLAALVVHHGGSGTTFGCLAAGVPQLVLPQGADQFLNAAMVAGAGAGEQLLPGTAEPDAVRDAAGRLLGGTARDATRRLAAEIAAMPPPADVVEQLPELAAAR